MSLFLEKKTFFFSGGGLTLVPSILRGIPSYYLSMFRILASISESLDQLFRNFLDGEEEFIWLGEMW